MNRPDDTNDHRSFALPGSSAHYGPDKVVAVEHIDLDLTVDLEHESLDGICTTTVRALDEAVAGLTLDAVDLHVVAVERDGRAQRFTRRNGKLEIELAPPIPAAQSATFAVHYRCSKPRHGLFFVRPTRSHPEKVVHAWTQSQDENARFWFPCLDYPHEKQPTSTTVRVPKGNFALANGELVERHDEGERSIFRYRQDVPHSTYLMTMVAGPFSEISQGLAGAGKTPVFYYVLPGREDDGERAFANTPQMIEVFEERTGAAYPYARYSQIAVSDFIFGGMENTSATTQTDRTLHDAIAHRDYSSDPLVSHELAHQWFGDLLTCRDWSHAWLNEGFATFFEAVWREAELGYDEYLYDIFSDIADYLEEDADRYRRPIVCNTYRDPIEIFDRHLYQKGAAVLHMLRGDLGDARFWRSIRYYVERNAQRNVETIDFIRAIEDATGRNLRAFFDQWVFSGGHPELEIALSWDAKRKVATLTVDQKQPIDAEHPPYRFDVQVGFVSEVSGRAGHDVGFETLPGERRLRAAIVREHETIAVPLEAEPKLVRFDPGAFVLGNVTYKLGTDHAGAVLRYDPDVVARIRAARELAKDGTHAAIDAFDEAFANEPFWGVLAQAAAAAGATRAPWARRMLVAAVRHAHPKVRRAVATALGNFRHPDVAAALISVAREDDSYFVRAAAFEALGKTRDPRAFDVLATALASRTWNSTVESGALRGLAELADPRALSLAIDACAPANDEGLRRAAAAAIARIGQLVEEARTRVVAILEELLDDPTFLVQLAALRAAETLGDTRLLPALDRLAQTAFDGRIRRDAFEAAIRIREVAKVPAQVRGMRSDIDELREDQRKLQEKIEALARS
ncbi:MAG: HEAT repeat domain-containing protein [Candidatus Eremiobacteraeota bacterium]|nr:HEAT repeat domain-containing protein [Candidatus Eremiobacteraeota bacterium]MBV8373050.1 HEAT repeat domain-containing protein [Candidatus Eremiobacteraeota bacterium]